MIQEPIQPVQAPTTAKPRTSNGLKIGLVAALCLALIVPVMIAIAANSAPPAVPLGLAAGASDAPAASGAPEASAKTDNNKGDRKASGFGRGGAGRGPITIRSINGSSLGLGTDDGWTRTIVVESTTTITKGGQPVALSTLKVGDEIRFSQKENADGTYTITAIVLPTPSASGKVTAVTDTTITVDGKGDTNTVITVNGSTVYKLGDAAAAKSDVTVGDRIAAQGTISGTTFTAITVTIRPDKAAGKVTAVTATTITVDGKGDVNTVITVNGSTVYKLGKDAATKADVTVGDRIGVSGEVNGTTFTADTVIIAPDVAGGVVTAKTADSITVKGRDDKTTVIHVSSKTTYKVRGKDAATIADIVVGDWVGATGVSRADGSLDATIVGGVNPKSFKLPKTPAAASPKPS